MLRRSFTYAAPLVLVLTSAIARAQTATATAPGAKAPGARPSANPLDPGAALPDDGGPNAPVSKVTESLEAKLASMKTGNGLTADEAARRALVNNVDITSKQKGIAAAEAEVESTQAQFYPKLDLSARYTRLSKFTPPTLNFGGMMIDGATIFPVIPNNYALGASLSIPLSDYVLRLSSSIAAVKHTRSAAKIDENATRLSVARDARVYYYQWIRAQGAKFVAEQALQAARGHAADAKNAFDAGLVPRADVLRTLSQEKSAELTVAHWANNVAISTEQLRVAMGDKPNVDYEIGENILTDLTPFAVPLDPGAGYAEALEHRLEIKQLGESEAALREEASVERAGDYPRLEAQANALYANPNNRYVPPTAAWHGTWDAGVVLSWTPTNIFNAEAQARGVEARADEVASQRNGMKNGLRLEVNQAMNALAEANFGLEASREGLAAAEENYRVRRELYRAGKATIVDVTDAETDLTRSRLEVVNSHVDVRISRVALSHALGRDVPPQK